LNGLLRRCDARFTPLADPLQLTFANHRWLDPEREREESYSDWLGWLLAGLKTEQILRLFGLENTEFGSAVRNLQVTSVTREECIQTPNRKRLRLDLVVRFDSKSVLLLELKIRDLDQAGGRGNLSVYWTWLQEQQPAPNLRAAVLVLLNQDDSAPADWAIRYWTDIAISLRRNACELYDAKPAGLLTGAMMLGFAGAVEQNLLGLSNSGWITAPQTTLYLERFLKEFEL
jgi:hypothetical protein